jgi:hypothetical protein
MIGMNRTLRREKSSGAPLFWATLLLVVCLAGAMMTSESLKKQAAQSETKFCWVGWTDADIWSSVALNSAALHEDNVLPVMQVDSVDELNNFRTHLTANGLTADGTYDEMPSFDAAVTLYDDDFFADKTLLLVYITESSGSIRHRFIGFGKDGSATVVQMQSVSGGDTLSTDMAGWLALIPVNRSDAAVSAPITAVRTAQ